MKTRSFIFLLNIFIINFIITSCNEEGTPLEPVYPKSSVEFFSLFTGFSGKHLIEVIENNPSNYYFITEISQSEIENGQYPPPETYTRAFTFFDYPSKVAEVYFDGTRMEQTSPLMPLPRFIMSVYWDFTKYSYNQKLGFDFKIENQNKQRYEFNLCETLHQVYLSCKDSLILNNAYNLTWNPSKEDDELWLDFIWTPKNSTSGSLQLIGFKIEDTGKRIIFPGEINSLGINTNGVLTINLLRFKKEFHTFSDGNKLCNITYTQAKVKVNVYKI